MGDKKKRPESRYAAVRPRECGTLRKLRNEREPFPISRLDELPFTGWDRWLGK
jgi:hypothetical protein